MCSANNEIKTESANGAYIGELVRSTSWLVIKRHKQYQLDVYVAQLDTEAMCEKRSCGKSG